MRVPLQRQEALDVTSLPTRPNLRHLAPESLFNPLKPLHPRRIHDRHMSRLIVHNQLNIVLGMQDAAILDGGDGAWERHGGIAHALDNEERS